jgi:hypothetical protein
VSTPLPGALVRMLVALAALAGALLSGGVVGGNDESAAAPEATPAAVATPAAPSQLQRALPVVAEQLVNARRSGRRELAAAHTSERQDAAALALSDAYHHAAVRLDKPAKAAGATVLLGALDRVSHAYLLLAKAARAGDRGGYKVARIEIADAERQLPEAFSNALADAS